MRITDLNWMQVEAYLKNDNRCVLPVGSTEQHAYLSLSVDSILAERVALEAAEPLGIPVFPVLHYGITPYFRAYPGTISIKTDTYLHMIRDILEGMAEQGFKRILVVNGHGGNSPGATLAMEFMVEHPDVTVQWHNWWNAPRAWAKVQAIDPVASHASWMENLPWTRLPGIPMPDVQNPPVDMAKGRNLPPKALRDLLGDGNYAGYYQRPDEDSHALWDVAIQEARDLLENGWA